MKAFRFDANKDQILQKERPKSTYTINLSNRSRLLDKERRKKECAEVFGLQQSLE
jgi:hypothetical protein